MELSVLVHSAARAALGGGGDSWGVGSVLFSSFDSSAITGSDGGAKTELLKPSVFTLTVAVLIIEDMGDPSLSRDCPLDCKVYVGNLGNSGNKNDLERAFGYYGPLRSVWVARNPPGFAFIEFEDPRDATDAVRELDGRTLCGCRVRVEMSSGEKRSRYRGPPPSWNRRSRDDSRRDDYRRRSPPPRRRSPKRSFSRSRSRSLSRERRRERSLSIDRNYKPSRSFSGSRSRSRSNGRK
ncbi:hypothetical protein DNTS_020759 [Danionella cerebrum]|uniref:RRM domain-containing protein n=1 Tax=Danionella cerebrum TaxID=2873325 RepID=A0A553MPB3_9TELE|nr:hypothetical protein DNTS_020759 [Danionella translucida]